MRAGELHCRVNSPHLGNVFCALGQGKVLCVREFCLFECVETRCDRLDLISV